MLVGWTQQPRLEQVFERRRVMALLAQRFELGSSIHVLNHRLQVPHKQVRDEMARVTQECAERSIASVRVLNGEGFWASTMRGLATSLHFLASQHRQFKLRVCGTIEDAAAWLPTVHNQRLIAPCSRPS